MSRVAELIARGNALKAEGDRIKSSVTSRADTISVKEAEFAIEMMHEIADELIRIAAELDRAGDTKPHG